MASLTAPLTPFPGLFLPFVCRLSLSSKSPALPSHGFDLCLEVPGNQKFLEKLKLSRVWGEDHRTLVFCRTLPRPVSLCLSCFQPPQNILLPSSFLLAFSSLMALYSCYPKPSQVVLGPLCPSVNKACLAFTCFQLLSWIYTKM